MAEISVPVKLQIQNLQSLVNELQNKLGNLKVGSTGFKAIQNTIASIRGEIDKLSIQTAKPFIDASQFTKAERAVEKLEDDIEKVGLVMSRLKFSDLELTSGQKADIKAFEDQLTSIKDKLKVVKNTAKDEFLNSSLGQEWLKIDETAFSKTLSQITNNIRSAVAEQNGELRKLEETAQSYQRALTENVRIKEFISKNNGDPLSQANLGDLYDKIFTTTTKGQFRYTSNGRNLLKDWLESQLHLDDSTINQIISKNVSAANVGEKLKEVLNSQVQQNQRVVDNNPNVTAQVDAAKAKYDELIAILRQVGLSEDQVAATEATLRNAFSQTTGEFNNYKEKLLAIAQGHANVQGTTNAMRSQLESLRTTLESTNGEFIRMQRTQQSFNQMKMAVVNFMGFNQVLNLTKNAIRNAINHIKELDSVMNKISIVTDMSTGDLWNQVDAYSKMAQTYGVSIKGAYEVSQIYYQQGLETNDVLTLTNETLKLARISGLDYAQTTDYMTTALRGFKMEMSEASTVVDVYSNLASHTAVSQEELAVAMSKTASSMESVGATFEEASAMIATMVAVTRESATNIGSAMKSIASRYGELTKDPNKLVDADGEAMAFNKVDTALQSVGISMKTVDGQFREFTDVIIELGEKWNQLESTQQRYIATQFAGNRQQSRFLALVSNVDLLKANMGYAEESEDTGTLQALKALDSIEAKTEQVRVAYQQFYTTIGAESAWKGFLDGAKNVINTLNSFPKLFGKLPIGALAAVASIISIIKSLGVKVISGIAKIFGEGFLRGASQAQPQAKNSTSQLIDTIINTLKGRNGEVQKAGADLGKSIVTGITQGQELMSPDQLTGDKKLAYTKYTGVMNYFSKMQDIDNNSARYELGLAKSSGIIDENQYNLAMNNANGAAEGIRNLYNAASQSRTALLQLGDGALTTGQKLGQFAANHVKWSTGLQTFGSALHMASMMIDTSQPGMKTLSGALMSISGAATLAGSAMQSFATWTKTGELTIPWMAIVTGMFALINGISTLIITPEEKLKELEDRAEELNNKAKEAKANYRTLDNSIKKLDELNEKRYESKEATEEYQQAVDDLTEKYPLLIKGFDTMGDVILDTASMEDTLTEARKNAAEAAYAAAKAEAERAKQDLLVKQNNLNSQIGSVKALPNQQNTRQLARYQNENGTWSTIDAYGGGTSLYEKLRNQDLLSDSEQRLLQYIEGLPEQFQTNGNILAKLMTQIGEEASSGNYNQAAQSANILKMAYETMNWQMPDYIEQSLESLVGSLKELGPLTDTIEVANKQMVNSWLRSSKYMDMSFISSNSGLSNLFQNQLYQQANGNYSESHLEQLAATLLDEPLQFWESLNEDEQTLFNKMFTDTKNYTKEDFKSEFGDKAFFPAIENLLETYYKPDIATIQNRANARLAQAMGKKADANGQFENIQYDTNGITEAEKKLLWIASHQLTLTEEQFYNSVIDQYESLNAKGHTGMAADFATSAAELYSQVSSAPAQIEAQLWELINTNGLNTLEGINNIKLAIKNNKSLQGYVDEEVLNNIQENIIPNINLSIQTITNELLSKWDDTSKELNKAISGGLSLEEADKLITQAKSLGLSFDISKDFVQNGNKLILSADAFNEYWTALNTANNEASDKLQENINKARSVFDKAKTYQQLTLDDRAIIQAIAPDFDFNQYLDTTGRLTNTGITELAKAIGMSQEGLQKYLEYNRIAVEQVKNSFDWALGDYSSYSSNIDDLRDLASGNVKLGKEDYNKKAIKENINKAYSSLISDVFTKGFTNINIDDYEGLIADDETALKEALEAGDYTSFIEKYAAFAGYTIDEVNQQMAAAIEKDEGLGKAKDAVDLISGGFNLTEFAKFLEKYNLGDYYSQFFDDTGKAIGDFKDLFVTNEQGIIEIAKGKEQEVLNVFNTILGANINSLGELWKGLLEDNLDKQIADLDKADVGKQASDSISKVASAKVGARINISKLPPEIQEKLDGNADGIYEVVSEFARDTALLAINANSIDDPEWKAQIREIQNSIKSKRNKEKGLKGVISQQFDRDAARTFLSTSQDIINIDEMSDQGIDQMMKHRGYVWDKYTQSYRATKDAIDTINEEIQKAIDEKASEETIAELRKEAADLEQALTRDKKRDALSNLLSNYKDAESSLSEFYAQFGAGFSKDELKQKGILTTDEHGKDVIDIKKLNEAIEGYDDLFKDVIDQLIDEYINNIQKAGSLITQGTTSISDMETFTQSYNTMFAGEDKTSADLFSYNDILKTWTLDPTVLRKYVKAQADKLIEEGKLNKEDVNKWINEQTSKTLASNVNISDYLSAESHGEGSDARNQLIETMTQYYQSYKRSQNDINDYITTDLQALDQGGAAAVAVVKTWVSRSGREATAEEIEQAFSSTINELNDAMDQLTDLTVGQITTGKLREYLQKAGKVDSNGVVTSVSDMVDVYQAIYDDMKKTAGKTTAGLNAAYAKVLTANEQKDIDTLDALENAAGMTYDALGELLAKYNIDLEEFMGRENNNGIAKAGFGKIKVIDWDTFANAIGLSDLDMNDPEFMKAYSDWVDARIEWENAEKQRMDDAVEEIKNLGDAKAGDKLNVSHLEAELGDSLAIVALSYSAELKDGLLTLTDKTDIPGLMSALADEAAKQGKLIPEQIAELADAVRDLLAQITSLIQGGIKGTLSHVDAQQLQSWADLHQLGELDFTETAEGLKLSQQSAIQLYNALNKVDKLQGSLVFKELNDSLKETNENYNSVSSIMNHIKDLDNKIADEKTSDARKQQYEEELSLAKEILAVRSTSEDDSFNFMSNKIPGAQNNPLNYYENWGKAFKSIKDAYKVGKKGQRGFMDYTDFYNIITEINNVAGQMESIIPVGKDIEGNAYQLDGSLEAAAKLIEAGASTLTSVDAGDIKVNIGKLGINLKDGATDMEKGIHEGVTAMANAQVDALDAMIAMLELIVSMEELGDIDVDSNGIEWEELFNLDKYGDVEGFSQGLTDWIDYCRKQIDSGNEDLKKGLESLKLNTRDGMKSLYDIFIGKDAWEPRDFNEKIDQNFKKLLPAMMNAMRKAAESNDWDPDHIAESMQSILNEAGLGDFEGQFAFDIGDTTFVIKNGLIVKAVDWSEEDVQAALKDYMKESGKKEEEAKQAILKATQNYLNGKGATEGVDLITILRVRQKIKIDAKGKPYFEGPDGKPIYEDTDANGWNALLQKAVLEDQGINPADIDTDLKGGTSTATITYGKKIKTKFKVTVDKDGKAGWGIEPGDDSEFSGFKGNYTTQEDLLKGMYNYLAEKFANSNGQDKNSVVGDDNKLLSYEQWMYVKYGVHLQVQPVVTKTGDDGKSVVVEDPANDPQVRGAIQNALRNKDYKPIDLGNGQVEVELNNGVKVKLNKEDISIDGENWDATLLEQALQGITGLDSALSETITQSIINAFSAIPEALNKIDAAPLESVANAIQRIAISSAALLITLPFVSAALSNLKININMEEFKGETIGQQIVSAIQSYLDSNPLKLKFNFDHNPSDSNTPNDSNLNFNKPQKAWTSGMDALTSTTSSKFKQISDAAKIDTTPIITFGREVKAIDPTNIERTAEATKEFKDDKIFAAVDALSKIEPKPIMEASEALTAVKQENGDAMKDASDGLSQVTVDNGTAMKDAATALASVIADNGTAVQNAANAIAAVTVDSGNAVKTAAEAVGSITNDQAQAAKAAAGAISDTVGAIANFAAPILQGSLTVSYAISGGGSAAGNMGGGALAGGTVSTLMGELGPELVVSNGRYFLAGQSGAEFVDLAKDAIVFNHLQTQRLMQQGAITGHGKPITNERNAVSYAKGNTGPAMKIGSDRGITDTGTGGKKSTTPSSNWPLELLWSILGIPMPTLTVTGHSPASESWPLFASAKGSVSGGPAMVSAKAALAALKQLRAQWKALAGMGAKDFAGLGGSGGGGGGGGNKDNKLDMAFIKDLELWYNWLQRIAVLEEKINYEEARRNEISSSFAPNGKEYYNSQKQTLDMLKEQAAVHQSLVESQQKYFDERRAKMNDSHNPFSQLYTFDEYGQLKYNNPNFESFMKLVGRDSETGKANMTAKEQYNEILKIDPQFAKYMEYDNSGNKIDKSEEGWEEKAVQAFWDKIDADQAEMQDLHNSIEEHKQAVLEAQEQANEILHEMEDNQLELENKVLSAIEESRQREIDELQKQRDALEQSSQALIDGLSEQLQKERDMYSRNEGQKELTGLQRQLAILQRSGGSASQIASLQKEISQKQQDAYFEAQQAQIDALQEASDKQLARLDKQIDLMTETLEYQKLYGMLWGEVYEVMAKSPAEIADYIRQNTESYWGQSTLQLTKTMRDDLFSAEQYKAMADDIGGLEYLVREYTEDAIKKKKEEEQRRAEEQKKKEEEARRKKEEEERKKQEEEERKKREAAQQKPKPSSGGGGGGSSGGPLTYISNNEHTHGVYQNGVKIRDEAHTFRGDICTLCQTQVRNFGKRASGGYVNHGIYELGEQGTETVLTAEQTQVLRDNILSNRPNSLISLLKSYNDGYNGINDNIKDVHEITDNSTVIEHATVEMHVSKIANDYDAQRAGEKALEKMISIARKTQAQNRVGR